MVSTFETTQDSHLEKSETHVATPKSETIPNDFLAGSFGHLLHWFATINY